MFHVEHSAALFDALGDAQGIGFLGDRPVAEVIAHADAFVHALAGIRGRVLDLGSGGGVPGLVIADARPDLLVTLLDRRQKRTDFLERVVRRLGWADRVAVLTADAGDSRVPIGWDAVVSRGFGPPDVTLRTAARLVAPGGLIVISEPPPDQTDRWSALPAGVERLPQASPAVAVFRRTLDCST